MIKHGEMTENSKGDFDRSKKAVYIAEAKGVIKVAGAGEKNLLEQPKKLVVKGS